MVVVGGLLLITENLHHILLMNPSYRLRTREQMIFSNVFSERVKVLFDWFVVNLA